VNRSKGENVMRSSFEFDRAISTLRRAAAGFALAAPRLPRASSRVAHGAPRLGLVAAVAAAVAALLAPGAVAQSTPFRFASPGQLPPIDAKTQAAVIDSVTAALDTSYVFGDKAARMDSLLHANLAAGVYAKVTDPAEFMMRLTSDVSKIYLDRHMAMAALPPGSIPKEQSEVDPFNAAAQREAARRGNYGFKKIEILPGNIGYLKLDQFAGTDVGGATAAGAMAVLANTDALIIDLRDNPGGNAAMIQMLTGYLFEESAHLIDWYHRRENETIQSWSSSYVPGKTLFDVPVYVLVSGRTGSAAEEFSFDLKNQKRGTIVGETTGGAAHTVEFHTFDVGPFIAGLKLPSGRALDPKSKTNWEAVGVTPDIAVSEAKALATARLEAMKKLEENAKDDAAKQAIAWARIGLESEQSPYTLPAKALKEYAGTFGPRSFFVEGSKLVYQREGRPKIATVPMAKDLFGLEGIPSFRVKFTRGATGAIDGIVAMYDDGHEETNRKAK